MTTAPPPFRFPLRADSWPVRDPDVGIAFPKGGMHGTFHAGVVHAFVMSGYLPKQVGGSSMGAYAATALAIASQEDDQARRLGLVRELIELWRGKEERGERQHPGRFFWHTARTDPKLKVAFDDLRRIPLSLEDLGRHGWRVYQGSRLEQISGGLRLWWGLFPTTRSGWRARFAVTLAGLRGAVDVLRGAPTGAAVRVAQALLDAYGLGDALLPINPGDAGFNDLFARWAPRAPLQYPLTEDLTRCHLTIQLTNLRWARDIALRKPGAPRSPVMVVKDHHKANLVSALRASASLQPMHAPQLARDVFPFGLPEGVLPDDPLVDSTHIAYMPIDRLVERWREESPADRARPKRIFAVLSDPLEGAPQLDPGFLAAGIHDLYLMLQRDQLSELQVTRLVSELARASKPEDDRILVVDPTPIAPKEMLGFYQVAVPGDDRVEKALAHGCRAALQVLHEGTLRSMAPPGGTVGCVALRARLRASSNAPDGYFQPLASLCALCTQNLTVPDAPRPVVTTELPEADKLDRLMGAPPPKDEPPVVVVPAGGSFLGVFHIGVLVALRDLGVRPDIYAGASVGTMFSMLMHGGLRAEKLDPRLIQNMFDVDTWADHDDHAPADGPVGRVDRLVKELGDRLRTPDASALLRRSPGWILDRLLDRGSPSERAEVDRGLAALLFPGFERRDGKVAPLTPTDAGAEASRAVQALLGGDLPGLLPFGDRIAAHLGVYLPGKEDDGELIGFDKTARLIRAFALTDPERPPTLAAHGGRGAHFLFSATNHTTGRPEFFGGEPVPDDPGSPDAVQAVLAASSLPLAFRRRSRAEVFGAGVPEPGIRYADGGIFDNFPVDSALKYLRWLSQYPEYRWLGHREVRLVLLPLEFPTPEAGGENELQGCLRTALLAWRQAEMQKLRRVLTQQRLVRRLAPAANEALRPHTEGLGPRLAIRSDFDIVAPARRVYTTPFAFKPWLGFTPDRQAELMAAGCRRARYAFLYRTWREAREVDQVPAPLEEFDKEVRQQLRASPRRGPDACVLGSLNPKPCAFLAVEKEKGPIVRRCCFASAEKDLPPESLPATSRVDAWVRLLEPEPVPDPRGSRT